MRIQICHTTEYTYAEAVQPDPHTIRLRPRCDGSQTLESFRMEIQPATRGCTDTLDSEGNVSTLIWFEKAISSLCVVTDSIVQTHRNNPFDFIVTGPAMLELPVKYPAELSKTLAHYASRVEVHPSVIQLAGAISDRVGAQTIPFLTELNQHIHQVCEYIVREQGPPLPPALTLANKTGACRDLALLFVDACRAMGLAARFVSGYEKGDPALGQHDLHAWAEVYLPGGGWRGYDPSLGVAVADGHVPLAASYDPRGCIPISGSFRGGATSSSMASEIKLSVLDAPHAPTPNS